MAPQDQAGKRDLSSARDPDPASRAADCRTYGTGYLVQGAERLARRYHAHEALPRLFSRERPGGRLLTLAGDPHTDLPLVLSECGGIAFSGAADSWGYSRATTVEAFATMYRRLMETLHAIGLLSGFCYTQFADTYQEANGLLYSDRRPKMPLEWIADATRGVTRTGDGAAWTETHVTGGSVDAAGGPVRGQHGDALQS